MGNYFFFPFPWLGEAGQKWMGGSGGRTGEERGYLGAVSTNGLKPGSVPVPLRPTSFLLLGWFLSSSSSLPPLQRGGPGWWHFPRLHLRIRSLLHFWLLFLLLFLLLLLLFFLLAVLYLLHLSSPAVVAVVARPVVGEERVRCRVTSFHYHLLPDNVGGLVRICFCCWAGLWRQLLKPSTCASRPHKTSSKFGGLPPLTAFFSPSTSTCWGSLQSSCGSLSLGGAQSPRQQCTLY